MGCDGNSVNDILYIIPTYFLRIVFYDVSQVNFVLISFYRILPFKSEDKFCSDVASLWYEVCFYSKNLAFYRLNLFQILLLLLLYQRAYLQTQTLLQHRFHPHNCPWKAQWFFGISSSRTKISTYFVALGSFVQNASVTAPPICIPYAFLFKFP